MNTPNYTSYFRCLFSTFTIAGLLTPAISLAEQSKTEHNQPQGIVQQHGSTLFAIDANKTIRPKFAEAIKDKISERRALSFVSDDGEIVSGTMAMPSKDYLGPKKVAFLFHPMGLDQSFWWNETHAMKAHSISASLRSTGFTVLTLDARKHGARADPGASPREVAKALISSARSATPGFYLNAIAGSVRDYRQLFAWVQTTFQPVQTLVSGYSMGAQMSILFASHEPVVDHALIMVPPFVANEELAVAPRHWVSVLRTTNLLWLAAKRDQYSSVEQTQKTFDGITSPSKKLVWFDSQHRLPAGYLTSATQFIQALAH